MPHFDVQLRTTVGNHTSSSSAGIYLDELPEVGDEIVIGDGTAVVEEIRRTDIPFIVAARTLNDD